MFARLRAPTLRLSAAIARRPAALPRRAIGAGYTGEREAGYDEAAMRELRALGQTPIMVLNLLEIVDLEQWTKYAEGVDAKFKAVGAENVYSGLLRDAPVPVRAAGIDTSDYSLVLLNKYPSADAFFELVDSDVYQAAYPHRLQACAKGKSSLIVTFPVTGTAV